MKSHVRGTTWNGMHVTYAKLGVPVNLTGFDAVSRFRPLKHGGDIFEFNITDGTLFMPSPANGKIFYKPRIINAEPGLYEFDLKIISPEGLVYVIVQSQIEILPNIS